MYQIKHVAVIGGGIMGGNIASFFANIGITSDLYDIDLNIVKKTLEKISDPNAKIPMLYTPKFVKKITPRHSNEMEKYLKNADLIVEAVPEKMEIKQAVFKNVDKFRREDSIVATNTSGLSVNKMIEGLSESISQHFVGTHYFNPVRFLPLVEIIPAKNTKKEIVEFLYGFYEKIGKKPIICKDTPNFIANRIGIYTLMETLSLMKKYKFDVETVDMITGTPLGNPKTATLRLCDMVGIDTVLHVALNLYHNCPNDEEREIFNPPEWLQKMVKEKMLGEKTGKGFYQKTKDKQILALDLETWEYKPRKKPRADEVRVAKGYQDVYERIRAMCNGDSPINNFCKEILIKTAVYSLNRIGEIADDILTIDNALKWGFNRQIGPIEVLDVFGKEKAIELIRNMGKKVPKVLEEIYSKTDKIYKRDGIKQFYFDTQIKDYKEIPKPKNIIDLAQLKYEDKIVKENLSARLIDLGDGVLLCELDHRMVPTMNPVDDFVMDMMWSIHEVIKKEGFKAVVISNQAENFSAGAQLKLLLEVCKTKQWKVIEILSETFQKVNMALYHADFPVITAPHRLTLGGGMEITLAGHKRVVLSEFYGGLVEVGVGLLPGGAGNLLLLMQFMDLMEKKRPGYMPPVLKSLELIAYGKVSTSAYDAIEKGLLKYDDVVVLNKDEQIKKAKEVALSLVDKHKPIPKRDLYLPGTGGYLVIESNIDDLLRAGKLTEYSAYIAKKQAYVLTGGKKASPVTPITEDEFLELEREAFVHLCGQKKTQERIEYMLKNKKPLIN